MLRSSCFSFRDRNSKFCVWAVVAFVVRNFNHVSDQYDSFIEVGGFCSLVKHETLRTTEEDFVVCVPKYFNGIVCCRCEMITNRSYENLAIKTLLWSYFTIGFICVNNVWNFALQRYFCAEIIIWLLQKMSEKSYHLFSARISTVYNSHS
jgi:hypothetical protein